MSQRTNNPVSCNAGEELAAYRRVKLSGTSRTVTYADAADLRDVLGVTETYAANGGRVSVLASGQEGTHKVTAAAAITALAKIYAANDGKVTATPNGQPIGVAVEAAGADGDIFEAFLFPAGVPQSLPEFPVADNVGDVDDKSGGTASETDELVAIGSTDDVDRSANINANFATLAAKVNELTAALIAADLMAEAEAE